MLTPSDLAVRHDPGEDVAPLLRALGGGLLGGLTVLAIDRVVPSPGAGAWLWPALLAEAIAGDARRAGLGAVVLLAAAALFALIFAYGQFRRFIPGGALHAGAAWGAGMALISVTALLPRAAAWMNPSGTAPTTALLGGALLCLAEMVVTGLAYGVVVGVLNPRGWGPR